VTLEFDKFFIVATYVPNAKQKLERLDYRTKEWDEDCLTHINNLKKTKPTIWTGDLNVAHEEIDLHDHKG
jgi:exonuclease III